MTTTTDTPTFADAMLTAYGLRSGAIAAEQEARRLSKQAEAAEHDIVERMIADIRREMRSLDAYRDVENDDNDVIVIEPTDSDDILGQIAIDLTDHGVVLHLSGCTWRGAAPWTSVTTTDPHILWMALRGYENRLAAERVAGLRGDDPLAERR